MAYSGNSGGGGIFYKKTQDPNKPEGVYAVYGGDPGSEGESTLTYVTNTHPAAAAAPAAAAPAPKKSSAPPPPKATTTAAPAAAPVEEKRKEITRPAEGLESTIKQPKAPVQTVSYLASNQASTSRFLNKRKKERASLFG